MVKLSWQLRQRRRRQIADVRGDRLGEKGVAGREVHGPGRQARKPSPRSENRPHAHVVAAGTGVSRAQLGVDGRPHDCQADAAEEQARSAGAGVHQHIRTDAVDREHRRKTRQSQKQDAE